MQLPHQIFVVAWFVLCLVHILVAASTGITDFPLLLDAGNRTDIVQHEEHSTLVRDPSQGHLVPRINGQRFGGLKVLSNGKGYGPIARFSDDMEDGEFWTRTCPVITSFKYLKDLFRCSKRRELRTRFLVHGNMTLVKRTVAEFNSPGSRYYYIKCEHMREAIKISLDEDLHERAVNLLEAAQARYAVGGEQPEEVSIGFKGFLYSFFRVFVPERNSMPLKRFLTLYGEKFKERCLNIFEVFCQELVSYLKNRLYNPNSRQLLDDWTRQPSLLTPVILINGFLDCEDDSYRYDFILYSWGEAIKEALKRKYEFGNESLWKVMVSEFSDTFSGEYPCTDEACTVALTRFRTTKQYLEGTWAKKNAPKLFKKLMELVSILLPSVLLTIISEYAITWIF